MHNSPESIRMPWSVIHLCDSVLASVSPGLKHNSSLVSGLTEAVFHAFHVWHLLCRNLTHLRLTQPMTRTAPLWSLKGRRSRCACTSLHPCWSRALRPNRILRPCLTGATQILRPVTRSTAVRMLTNMRAVPHDSCHFLTQASQD